MARYLPTLRGRWIVVLTVAATAFAAPVAVSAPAQAKAPGPNGQIAFFEDNGADRGTQSVFTISPDGTHQQLVVESADSPHWSPDGRQIAMECNGLACGTASALIANPDTGSSRLLPSSDPTLGLGCFAAWSPDGKRLLCGSLDDADPSRNGIYTVRASDGGGLTRLTTIAGTPGDFSPDGSRVSFDGADPNGNLHIYVVSVHGGRPTAITPDGLALVPDFGGSWSPSGDQILFVARPTPDSRRALWIVNADGSGLHMLPIPGCGGLFSDPKSLVCGDPTWSPDGNKIAFSLGSSKTHRKDIYTANADGSDLFQVTHTGRQDFAPDWGTHPLAR